MTSISTRGNPRVATDSVASTRTRAASFPSALQRRSNDDLSNENNTQPENTNSRTGSSTYEQIPDLNDQTLDILPKDYQWRVCLDYRVLNNCTKHASRPIPNIGMLNVERFSHSLSETQRWSVIQNEAYAIFDSTYSLRHLLRGTKRNALSQV